MTETTVHEELTVGRVADLVGVSVRTLHHWDAIGLVRPSGRSWSGYRLYDAEDVARIHRVLVYRELGLALAQIGGILDDPFVDPREHLQRQRALLQERIRRLEKTARAVDEMIERTDMNDMNDMTDQSGQTGQTGQTGKSGQSKHATRLSPEEQARIFGTDWDPAYQDEARERWGDSDAWKQSAARTRDWGTAQWQEVKDETEAVEAALAEALGRGVAPGSEEANALAEQHRATIARHYDCTRSMQVVLARMYTEDPRFAAHYDERAEGLAVWVRSAIEENARAHGVDPGTATWQ
ncbi:MAG: MerR family transcriptional regulator [Brachybacterium sp.]|nr:MerR family transcriptional regulator [Brachybacterium sp.]MDN6329471.1 MerR family transcriptional regulator [Brachybacterium sp.]MDN6400280.1 MerR family transcriptional regulator [Brachybacterium sp.]